MVSLCFNRIHEKFLSARISQSRGKHKPLFFNNLNYQRSTKIRADIHRWRYHKQLPLLKKLIVMSASVSRSLPVVVAICTAGLLSFNLQADDYPTIPHGDMAKPLTAGVVEGGQNKGIVSAWYSCPTTRYRHGVLGDAVEGGCLLVTDDQDKQWVLNLEEKYVFEDTTPRIADMNGDGKNDVVTIRSDNRLGAALIIYTLGDDGLQELGSTPPIGKSNRWLAPAGIADFNNDGQNDVTYVQTPHIGGTLRFWSMNNGKLEELANMRGFSNHSIGATRVSISRVYDANEDGVQDIALPDFAGKHTIVVTLYPELKEVGRIPFESAFFD